MFAEINNNASPLALNPFLSQGVIAFQSGNGLEENDLLEVHIDNVSHVSLKRRGR
jgi:hypothetical protein